MLRRTVFNNRTILALKTATIPRTLPSVALFHTTRLAMSTTKTHESLTVVSTTSTFFAENLVGGLLKMYLQTPQLQLDPTRRG